jgi:hypothetical protein
MYGHSHSGVGALLLTLTALLKRLMRLYAHWRTEKVHGHWHSRAQLHQAIRALVHRIARAKAS